MSKRQLLLYSLSAILLIYALVDYMDYNRRNLDVRSFVFQCNETFCEIRHKKANGDIKYTDKIDINKIERFSTRLETIPRVGKEGLVIYAECKDGTSFRFSPIYIRPSTYVETELIVPLNKALKREPIRINMRFPY